MSRTPDAAGESRPGSSQPAPSGSLVVAKRKGDTDLRFSLVIPTYNESQNIPVLVETLDGLLREHLGDAFELIVVDDDSPDQTWALAEELSLRFKSLRVVRRVGERGLSTAVIRGWQVARGDILGVIDADLQHPPEVTLALLKEMESGADLAVASRNAAGGGVSDWSLLRRGLSRGAQLLGLLLVPGVFGRLSDPMSGFFMLRRSCIAGIELDPLGYKILIETVARGRIRWIAETPYTFRERSEGDSKVTFRLYIEYLRHLAKLRFLTLGQSRLLRYLLVGMVGVTLDMSLLYLFSEDSMWGWGIARSKVLAAQPAIVTTFLLHENWTFARRGEVHRPQALGRFLAYFGICLVNLFFVVTILSVLVEFAHTNRYLANAVAILSLAGTSYWLHRRVTWIFPPSDAKREPGASSKDAEKV